jgi:hypothetical protein
MSTSARFLPGAGGGISRSTHAKLPSAQRGRIQAAGSAETADAAGAIAEYFIGISLRFWSHAPLRSM